MYSEHFRAAFGHEYRMLELSDVPTISVAQRGVDLHETNLSEFLDQCVPLTPQRFCILLGKWSLQQRIGSPLCKGEGAVTLLDVSSHGRTERLNLALGQRLANLDIPGDPHDVR